MLRAGKGEGWGVAGKSRVESRKRGDGWRPELGDGVVVGGKEGGSENIRHLVCLCVSKGDLALSGVLFPPWNEAEVKMEEI